MKRSLRILMIALCAAAVISLPVIALTSAARFDHFCDAFFREELSGNALTLHYTVSDPESFGIKPGEISMGSCDTDTDAQKRWLLGKKMALQTFAKGQLSDDQQMLYDLLNDRLDTELSGLAYTLLEEPLVPTIGIQSQLPVLLAEYSFQNEADVETYLTLLQCVPEYFDSILALEEKKLAAGLFMDSESAAELIDYCKEFLASPKDHFLIQTFAERIAPLSLSADQQEAYIKKNAKILETAVFPAYETLQNFLTEHRDAGSNPNGLSYYPDGTDYYAWLLRSEVGIDHSFDEIETMLNDALKEDARTIATLTAEHPELLSQRTAITIDTSNPAALTKYLAARASHDFPEIPDVSFEICDVPASMEAHLSPAFYLVPPVDDCEKNVIYLNNASLKTGISFFTTLAHEGYPGHLYQTVYDHQNAGHPLKRLLQNGGYLEGWATYAEQLSYYYAPISEDLATLLSTTRAMTLNLYSHLDLYVHAYGWTEEDCSDYLKKFGITNAASVHEMFLLVKQQPANYLKYYVGYLEICNLKKQAMEALGDAFDLKEFHKFILSNGPAPFTLLETYFKTWLNDTQKGFSSAENPFLMHLMR